MSNKVNLGIAAITLSVLAMPLGQVIGQSPGTMTDPRDGKTYKTVKLGKMVWMAENLNYNTPDSWCYLNKPDYCNKYGRLYTWESAMNACPAGWTLPADGYWELLLKMSGGCEIAGSNLLQGGSSGFNASLGGIRCNDGEFISIEEYGDYWSSTSASDNNAWLYYFFIENCQMYRISYNKETARSVRCIQK